MIQKKLLLTGLLLLCMLLGINTAYAEEILMLACNLLCFKMTRELPPEEFGSDSEEKVPFFKAVKTFVTNKYC